MCFQINNVNIPCTSKEIETALPEANLLIVPNTILYQAMSVYVYNKPLNNDCLFN